MPIARYSNAMENPFEIKPDRYQRTGEYVYARDPKLRFDQRRLARAVGLVAFGLPIVLGVGGYWLGDFREALSGYYYEELVLGDVFVGSLVVIASLLLAYRGWTPHVARLATFAGLATLLVAFVPMYGWVTGCEELDAAGQCTLETRLYPGIGYWVHAGAAGALFAVLAFFCFFVFTRVPAHRADEPLTSAKRARNWIYRVSGTIIVACSLAIAAGDLLIGDDWRALNLTFWMEALLLVAFGTSWLVQGRAVPAQLRDPEDQADAAEARRRMVSSKTA